METFYNIQWFFKEFVFDEILNVGNILAFWHERLISQKKIVAYK